MRGVASWAVLRRGGGRSLGAIVLACALAAACGGGDDSLFESSPVVCAAGQQIACACPGGAVGAQACRGDGAAYLPCVCPEGSAGAAGAGGGAGAAGMVTSGAGGAATGGSAGGGSGASGTAGAGQGGGGGAGTGGTENGGAGSGGAGAGGTENGGAGSGGAGNGGAGGGGAGSGGAGSGGAGNGGAGNGGAGNGGAGNGGAGSGGAGNGGAGTGGTGCPSPVPGGATCDTAQAIGAVVDVGSPAFVTVAGALDAAEAWFAVDTTDLLEAGANSYHVSIELLKNPDDEFAFVALRGGDCAQLASTPATTAYDWCVNLGEGGVGQAPCGFVVGQNHCRDVSAPYRIGVRRKPGTTPTCAAFELRIRAGAGPCAPGTGCGSCSDGSTCFGGSHATCKGGTWVDDPCPEDACHAAVCQAGACQATALPAGTPCGGGNLCGASGKCLCPAGSFACQGKALLQCQADGTYVTVMSCTNGCVDGKCQ